MCLSKTVGLIANVSVDNIWLVGYSDRILVAFNSSIEIRISSTLIVCESIEGQALVALQLSAQERTYDQALLKCLGIYATTLKISFTSLGPTTKPTYRQISYPVQTDRPSFGPTPRPTLSTENGKNYCDSVKFIQLMLSLSDLHANL